MVCMVNSGHSEWRGPPHSMFWESGRLLLESRLVYSLAGHTFSLDLFGQPSQAKDPVLVPHGHNQSCNSSMLQELMLKAHQE